MKKINATEQTIKMDRDENNDKGEEQNSEIETARGSDNDGDVCTYIQRNARNRRFAKVTGSCEMNVNNQNDIEQCSERQMVSARNNESNKCLDG